MKFNFLCRGFAFMSNANLMVLIFKNVFVQKGFICGFCANFGL